MKQLICPCGNIHFLDNDYSNIRGGDTFYVCALCGQQVLVRPQDQHQKAHTVWFNATEQEEDENL